MKKEKLYDKIILMTIKMTEKTGYRILYVGNKDFGKQDLFEWADTEAKKSDAIILDLKII